MHKFINYVIIIISFLLTIFIFLLDLITNIALDSKLEILLYLLPILFLFFNMLYQVKKEKDVQIKEKIKKQSLILILIIYILELINILFVSSNYRINYLWNTNHLSLFSTENIARNINVIPFKTICSLISRLLNHTINLSIVLENILGNLIIFAPFGFFIPMLFANKIKTLKSFTLLMLVIIFGVEILQFLLSVGQADIDDIILNLLGAVLVYLAMRTTIAKKIIKKVFNE